MPFCRLLNTNNNEVIQTVLEGVMNLLMSTPFGPKRDSVLIQIQECRGLEMIKCLQNYGIIGTPKYTMAFAIIKNYFSDDLKNRPELRRVASQLSPSLEIFGCPEFDAIGFCQVLAFCPYKHEHPMDSRSPSVEDVE
ncbi:uncharacterized protein LOC136029130 [Artemia franciscana]|uniref:uncharacterized protein LOC136029130 n=1 Tax=Artemia franciscana TaxID=6661 RepID=UPI0032DA7D9C